MTPARCASLACLLFALGCAQASPNRPEADITTQAPLVLDVACRDGRCVIDDDDLFLTLTLTSRAKGEVGVPLAFWRSKGPSIRLQEPSTGAETFVRNLPGNPELLEQWTMVPPGGSVSLDWVLNRADVEQMGDRSPPITELLAEVTLMADVLIEGARRPFRGFAELRVGVEPAAAGK